MLAAVVVLSVLAACGGSSGVANDGVDRSAKGSTDACPDTAGGTIGFDYSFVNQLDTAVLIRVDPNTWNCNGFDGPSTPGALNGLAVGAGATVTKHIEFRDDSKSEPRFRMAFYVGDGVLRPIAFAPYSSMLFWMDRVLGYRAFYASVADGDGRFCRKRVPARMPDGSAASIDYRWGDARTVNGSQTCEGGSMYPGVITFSK